MKKLPVALAAMALFGCHAEVSSGATTYDATVAGMKCKQQSFTSDMECDYHVGNLHFTIAGVGMPDAGIAFMHSDFNDDYYASMAMQSGCIVVKRSSDTWMADLAFVSPRTGKVYRDWVECGEDGKGRARTR